MPIRVERWFVGFQQSSLKYFYNRPSIVQQQTYSSMPNISMSNEGNMTKKMKQEHRLFFLFTRENMDKK